jgi:hypothetical protein
LHRPAVSQQSLPKSFNHFIRHKARLRLHFGRIAAAGFSAQSLQDLKALQTGRLDVSCRPAQQAVAQPG